MALHPTPVGDTYRGHLYHQAPRNVYWETTLACDLACKHCRANANPNADPRQLSTEEGKRLIDAVRRMGSMLVLTGGDPLKRDDLFELIAYGRSQGVPVAVTPSTTPLLTRDAVQRFKDLRVTAMGVSLDGPNAEIHDGFRNVPGTFDCSMQALGWARSLDIPVQVNTTVTAETLEHLPAMYELLSQQHAPPVRRWSLFMLVPTGRGTDLGAPTADQVEELFAWVYAISGDAPFRVGTTEAPHYRRYWIQRKLAEGMPRAAIDKLSRAMSFGIRDGNGVVFVSHVGDVYPAGFLPHPLLGNVRERPLDEIYREEPRLQMLRDPVNYRGRCGACEFKWACGGSRARAYSMTGDELGTDPLCAHEPKTASVASIGLG